MENKTENETAGHGRRKMAAVSTGERVRAASVCGRGADVVSPNPSTGVGLNRRLPEWPDYRRAVG